MECAEQSPQACANGPPRTRRFRPARFTVWLTIAIVLAAALAWLAVQAATRFAPLLLFPVAVGLLLGLSLVTGLRLTDTAHRASVLAGTILASAIVIVGQHYASYLAVRSVELSPATALAAQAFPEVAHRLPPHEQTFPRFLQNSAAGGMTLAGAKLSPTGVWLQWGADALVTLGVTIAVVGYALRRPFCDACGTWYRVTRAGQVAAAPSAAIAALSGCTNPPDGTTKYELAGCRGGCGPTAFKLLWSGTGRRIHSAWLDHAALAKVIALIDRNDARQQTSRPSATSLIAKADR